MTGLAGATAAGGGDALDRAALKLPVNRTGGTLYYVSGSKGDDANDGSFDEPFKTISRAAELLKAGDTCLIREGIYRETVRPANDGTKARPILFAPYKGEKVTVSGADEITARWEKYRGSIYRVALDWSMGLGKDQVFADGEVMLQARYPNKDVRSSLPVTYSKLFPTRGYFSVDYDFIKQINSPYLTQTQPDYWKDGIFVGGQNAAWTWQTAIIKGSQKGRLTVADITSRWWFPITGFYSAEMSEGYITNSMNALDIPGEWHVENNALYAWMPKGDDPSRHTVEAKKRVLAFDLADRKGIYVYGLHIFAASVTMAESEDCVLDGVLASHTSHFTLFDDARDGFIDSNAVRKEETSPKSGQAGIYISGRYNKVINSTIRYSAGAGLYLAGYGTVVDNNIIHDAGYACTYLGLIHANDEFGNVGSQDDIKLGKYTITRNTLYNTGRAALSFGGLNDAQTYYAGSEIAYNQIFNTMLFTSDGGAFYAYKVNFGADGKRTRLHHNLFWNSFRKSGEGVIYADNMCEGLDVDNNVMWSHAYSDKGFLILKTDSPHKDYLPRDRGGNKNLGIREILPGELKNEDFPGGKRFQTGALHGEDPAVKQPPQLPVVAKYVPPAKELSRSKWKASASSSFDEDTAPLYAIDEDDTYTYWRIKGKAQAPGDWFMLDLGRVSTFSRITMKCSGVKSPRAYLITVSKDGKKWSDYVGMGDSAQAKLDIKLFTPQNARYIKIQQTERTHPDWGQYWMIQDLRVYEK